MGKKLQIFSRVLIVAHNEPKDCILAWLMVGYGTRLPPSFNY
jgi:hypothetical protein